MSDFVFAVEFVVVFVVEFVVVFVVVSDFVFVVVFPVGFVERSHFLLCWRAVLFACRSRRRDAGSQ